MTDQLIVAAGLTLWAVLTAAVLWADLRERLADWQADPGSWLWQRRRRLMRRWTTELNDLWRADLADPVPTLSPAAAPWPPQPAAAGDPTTGDDAA